MVFQDDPVSFELIANLIRVSETPLAASLRARGNAFIDAE